MSSSKSSDEPFTKRSGLTDSRSLRDEARKIKEREESQMRKLPDDYSGRHAATVYRDRGTGAKRDMERESKTKIKEDQEAERIEAEKRSKYKEWSTGLKQREDQKEKLEFDLKQMSKPLARYSDDVDRDDYLKSKELTDDPMLSYVKKKREKEKILEAKSRGEEYFVKPKYRGPPAPANRFNIQPGYRWDGVDRSNGYEKKLIMRDSEKMALKDEAYKWSTEDM